MSLAAFSFVASFLFIFLKAFQQLNVVHYKYWLVVPTSFTMAICEVYVMANVAQQGFHWSLVAAVGLGGGLGCICSMWVHKRLVEWWKSFCLRSQIGGVHP